MQAQADGVQAVECSPSSASACASCGRLRSSRQALPPLQQHSATKTNKLLIVVYRMRYHPVYCQKAGMHHGDIVSQLDYMSKCGVLTKPFMAVTVRMWQGAVTLHEQHLP